MTTAVFGRVGRVLRAHWLFLAVFAVGTALRVLVELAYRPALLYSDSVDYIGLSKTLTPGVWHPLGYPLFLASLSWTHDLAVVAAVQHVIGLGVGLLFYLLLGRLGARPWVAALGATPALLDPYQLNIEQYVMSDGLFEALVVAALAVLLWRRRPGVWRCAVAGLFFAMAAVTRVDALVVVVPALLYLVVRRVGVKAIAALVLAAALPVVAYAGWYDADNGGFAMGGLTGLFLYGRVAPWADCTGLVLPPVEQPLCPTLPADERPGFNWYTSQLASPATHFNHRTGPRTDAVLTNFDRRIILHQPLTYAGAVGSDWLRQFLPSHSMVPKDVDPVPWMFGTTVKTLYVLDPKTVLAEYGNGADQHTDAGIGRFLADYQRFVYTPGPLLALALLAALAGVVGLGRARRRDRRHLNLEVAVLAASGALLVLFAVATVGFTWRYTLPVVLFYPAAAALAAQLMVAGGHGDRRPAPVRPTRAGAVPAPFGGGPRRAGRRSAVGPRPARMPVERSGLTPAQR